MASRNGQSVQAVALVKKSLLLNTTRNNKGLQELTQAINSRTSGVPGTGSAYERFFGRKPLLSLPCLPSKLTTEQKERMNQKMSEHRDRYCMKFKNTRLEQYNINDPVLVFNPRSKNFSKEAKIVSYDPPPSDALGPRDYEVEFKEGGRRRVN